MSLKVVGDKLHTRVSLRLSEAVNVYTQHSMSSGRQDYKALINWYVRNGLYRHAYDECSRLQAKRGAESHILFWKAVSAGLGGSSAEAIRDLHDLRPKRVSEGCTIYCPHQPVHPPIIC